mmetsp:Transcript_40636/g.66066  ORF Transcript_40636/g.66066 Transcript_40636/m.66066 type:complete len:287 (+) Transcript_40636:112-972(+)|eukprot:jgi/Bigna1/90677/estExt_fgenesh1_pg.C_760072
MDQQQLQEQQMQEQQQLEQQQMEQQQLQQQQIQQQQLQQQQLQQQLQHEQQLQHDQQLQHEQQQLQDPQHLQDQALAPYAPPEQPQDQTQQQLQTPGGDTKENGSVQHMLLHVPADAKPGQKVTFAAPNGVYYQVTVPEGAKPGTPFRVAVPTVNPMSQWAYFQRMAAQLQSAMPMLQQMAFQGAGGQTQPTTGSAPIMGVRRPRKTRKDKGKSRGPYRIRSERLYAELAAQEGVIPQGGPPQKRQRTELDYEQQEMQHHQYQATDIPPVPPVPQVPQQDMHHYQQ